MHGALSLSTRRAAQATDTFATMLSYTGDVEEAARCLGWPVARAQAEFVKICAELGVPTCSEEERAA